MDSSVLVALISGGLTLIGVLVSNRATRAALEQKVDDLSERVDRHNHVVERVYALEADQAANEERFKTLFSRVERKEG